MKRPIFRIDEILRLCRSKSVLHLGFIQHAPLYKQLQKEGKWLHYELSKVTNQLVGIDLLNSDIEDIKQEYGFEGYTGDVQELAGVKLNRKFDVILCGELIEHLTNPGLMLEGVKRFMNSDSIIIITTPNAYAKEYYLNRKTLRNESDWINPEHVCWYSKFTLENTLQRHGFTEELYSYYFGFERQKDYFENDNSIVGRLKNLKRKNYMNNLNEDEYLGLFFIARLP